MEDPDGFIRTVPETITSGHHDGSGSDSDDSMLQFENGLSNNSKNNNKTNDGNNSNNDDDDDDVNDDDFFEDARSRTTAAAPWNFEEARREARDLESYQTSIDVKIRTAREKMGVVAPPTNDDDDDDDDDDDGDNDNDNDNDNGKDNNNNVNTSGQKGNNKDNENSSSCSDDDDDDDDDDDEKTDKNKQKDVKKGNHGELKKKKQKKKRERTQPEKVQQTFMDLKLCKPLQKAIDQLEWYVPTPIQVRAIPYIIGGRDVCASAVTGSGKTAAFVLPILENLVNAGMDNVTRVIIILPTRELAAQCHSVIVSLSRYTRVRVALAVGGLCGESQETTLRTRPHIIVATPGRLIDHVRNSRGVSLHDVNCMILDEGDRLLDMGFRAEIEEILSHVPKQRQTLLFSATISKQLKSLIQLSLKDPVHIAIDEIDHVAKGLKQEFIKVRDIYKDSKHCVLLALCNRTFRTKTIIFFRQKVTAHRMKILFGLAGLSCAELHGNLTQAQRLKSLDDFREGNVNFLLCTDVAARGIDIIGITTVINYDMPTSLREYIHRVGRTARAGREGIACSFVMTDSQMEERKVMKQVVKKNNNNNNNIMARVIPPKVIAKWTAWSQTIQPALKNVLAQERMERELRMAEMENTKAKNMLKYEQDIYSRPARTWFRSELDKIKDEEETRNALGLPPPKTSGHHLNEKHAGGTRAAAAAAGTEGKVATLKRKAEQVEKRKEDIKRRKQAQEAIARQEDFAKQRMDARKQKRTKSQKRRKR